MDDIRISVDWPMVGIIAGCAAYAGIFWYGVSTLIQWACS
jgi:hypothetical protein